MESMMKLLKSKIFWIRVFFILLGLLCIGAGLYALYSFTLELFELYKRLILGMGDTVKIFVVLFSFFLGAPALIVMGFRLIAMRSFSSKMLLFAIFPVSFWFLPVYDTNTIFEMDTLLTFGVLLFITYMVFFYISFFMHKYWYTPHSHEKIGHVGIEEQNKKPNIFLRIVLIVAVIFALLALHPADFTTTISMLVSPIQALINL